MNIISKNLISPIFVLLLSLGVLLFSGACCHDIVNYCFHFHLKNSCPECDNNIVKTKFIVNFNNTMQTYDEFAGAPFSLCFPGDEGGGQTLTAMLVRVCNSATHLTVMTCITREVIKVPESCDYQWRDIDVVLTCECQ